MKTLMNLYDRLSSEERFSAFIAAGSRLDTKEMDLLNDTCPEQTYRMPDWEYTHAKYRFFGCMVLMQLRLAKVTNAMAALALVAAYVEDDDAEKGLDAARKLIVHHRTLLQAWELFCERIGIEREVGRAILSQDDGEFSAFMLEVLDEVTQGQVEKPDPEVIEKEVGKLMETWG